MVFQGVFMHRKHQSVSRNLCGRNSTWFKVEHRQKERTKSECVFHHAEMIVSRRRYAWDMCYKIIDGPTDQRDLGCTYKILGSLEVINAVRVAICISSPTQLRKVQKGRNEGIFMQPWSFVAPELCATEDFRARAENSRSLGWEWTLCSREQL